MLLTCSIRKLLRATTACTFSTSTSKSGPNMLCGWHIEMCFAPQRRAIFQHLNFQERTEMLRARGAFFILTSKRASRHSGAQVLISHTTRWLRTRHFSESTFRPSGATNPWKNTVFRDFPTFSRTLIFFLLSLSLLWYSFFFLSLLRLVPPWLNRFFMDEAWSILRKNALKKIEKKINHG